VREIILNKSDVYWPYHTIELTNGQLVVSYERPVDGVSVVNGQGQVVASSSRNLQINRNFANKPFNRPLHLAVCENGRILVADYINNRIVELNNSLTWSRDLSLPFVDRLQRPTCLYLDKSRDWLYVGEYGAKRVLVFDNFE
jgi:hypothetical protein